MTANTPGGGRDSMEFGLFPHSSLAVGVVVEGGHSLEALWFQPLAAWVWVAERRAVRLLEVHCP